MIGWVDGSAGASGDMLLGALVSAGVPLAMMQEAVDRLGVGVTLVAGSVQRAGLVATKVDVQVPASDASARSYADVRALPLGERAAAVFARLAAAEAAVHGVAVDDVHFHEVGGHDALADVVGVCAGFEHLGLSELHCSTLSLGSGLSRGAHGPLPVPGPAVLQLLRGVPVQAGPAAHEATTPTGAALLAELVTQWGSLPAMTVAGVGLGAGGRDVPDIANVLRLVVGETLGATGSAVVLETNVDDLDPRLWPHVLSALLAAGADDAWLTPILMKKGRPAHTLSVLCSSPRVAALREVVFRETSTLGVREIAVGKVALERSEEAVEVDGQRVRVKVAWLGGERVNANPEWEDVVTAAAALGRPAKDVLTEAIAQIRRG